MEIDVLKGVTVTSGKVRRGHQPHNAVFPNILNAMLQNVGNNATSNNDTHSSHPEQQPEAVFIGKISKKHPTVSHLLIDHPDYRQSCWKIIHSEQNRNKPFTKIDEGTRIYINKSDLALFWDKDTVNALETAKIKPDFKSPDQQTVQVPIQEPDSFSKRFIGAIKHNLGMDYDKVNCYELIVQGLKQLGYRYGGNGGLKETLINLAQSRGASMNTYFSGEGLIESSGTADYVKSFEGFSNHRKEADKIMDEIASVIQPGQILSFSTPSRGHTGIISNKGNQWTFVNSGILDNNIGDSLSRKGVGEESLVSEIYNWVKLAARKNEPLILTLGHLDENKLEKYKVIPLG